MTLRMRVLPRFPAKITGTAGITTMRDGPDIIIKSDYGSLIRIPSVANEETTFFKVWNQDNNSYSIMTFEDVIAAIGSVTGVMAIATYDPQGIHSDAFNRANHTGVEPISAVSGLQTALDAKLALSGGVMTGAIQDLSFAPSSAPTKKAHFDLSRITAGQDRDITVPDVGGLALNKEEAIGDFIIAPGTSSLAITGLLGFRKLLITGKILPSATSNLLLRTSINGTTYDSGASDYAYQLSYSTQTTQAAGGVNAAAFMNVTPGPCDAGGAITFEMLIEGFNKTEIGEMLARSSFIISGFMGVGQAAGQRNSTAARQAIQFLMSTGTFAGAITVKGIRG